MSTSSPLDPNNNSNVLAPTLTVQVDRTLVRAESRSTRYALVSVAAPTAMRNTLRIPVNLAIVLDRSGSMAGEKFVLARRAVEQALAQLQSGDRFALVIYDDAVDVLAESTLATTDAKRAALAKLARLEPRGSTDLSGGWMRGCEQVAFTMSSDAHTNGASISRCLLLTDGLANRGITDRDELVMHASALRARGVQTSTFGVGADFDERLLAGMADAGGGHFYFLADARQIPELIASEVGEALEVVVRGAMIEARLPRGMTGKSLGRFKSRSVESEDGVTTLTIDVGDLVSAQELEIVIALAFPKAPEREAIDAQIRVTGGGHSSAAAERLRFIFASHAENDGQPRNRAVDRRVAALFAERARSEALEYQRAGHYERARGVLTATAARIRQYAGDDQGLDRIAAELRRDVASHTDAPMPAMEMKERYFRSYAAGHSRAPSGRRIGRGKVAAASPTHSIDSFHHPTTQTGGSVEASHWYWRHLFQGERCARDARLVQAASRHRCPVMGRCFLRLGGLGWQAHRWNDRLVGCSG